MAIQDFKAQNRERQAAILQLMVLIQAPDFPGKLMDEHIAQFEKKLENFTEFEIAAVYEKIQEEIQKKKQSGKTLLISKIEDLAALTKMEVILQAQQIPTAVVNMLLIMLVNKSSDFAAPIFQGKIDDLQANSIENAVLNIVLENVVSSRDDGSGKTGRSKELRDLFDRKMRDTETLIHLIELIDGIDLNREGQIKSVFVLNLLAEAMKRDETMRKSESITMKDMVNLYLLSKLQMKLAEFGYPHETLEGIIINRLGQSNNIRRQFLILNHIIKDTLSGELNIELGSKTEKLEWLKLVNELEINVALEQYDEKLTKDGFQPVSEKDRFEIPKMLQGENIADQTIAAISFARRLDNPDETLHEPGKLLEVAVETQYLTSMIFKVKGFQIKEVYEFVELIGELDVKNEHYERVVEYFKAELPCIDKTVMKEEDPDIKKAALASRYLSARMMNRFDLDPEYLNLTAEHVSVDHIKLTPDQKSRGQDLAARVAFFNDIRKRLAFFNKAERAFLTMNKVESLINTKNIELDRDGVFRVLELINETELGFAIGEYVKQGTIAPGQEDGEEFSAAFVEQKIKALFEQESIQLIEKDSLEKNIIPASILSKADEDGELEETVLDIQNYATYLVTRRLDRPEYPRHLERALNLIFALIQDAIGWRHFENSQIRAKHEVVPLIEEYHRFLGHLLDALNEDKDPSHEEVISKIRDDDFFAITDNKDSLEAGKKSAPQVRTEFLNLMGDDRFQQYIAKSMGYADKSANDEWQKYYRDLDTLKLELKSSMEKTGEVIDHIIKSLKSDTANAGKYKDHIQTLQVKYLGPIKKLDDELSSNRKPSTIIKIEYDRVVNSDKFKLFVKHCFELTKTIA